MFCLERFVVVGECFLVLRGAASVLVFIANLSNIAFSGALALEQKILGKTINHKRSILLGRFRIDGR